MADNNIEPNSKQLGGIFLLIGWLSAIGLVAFLFNKALYEPKEPSILQTQAGMQITIHRDFDSHFRISGSINGTPVIFLIDTGATDVSISEHIARKAKLTKLYQVQAITANGNTAAYETKIDDLKLGNLDVGQASALIIPNIDTDEALLGMNVLKKFHMQQDKDTLIITVPQGPTQGRPLH